MMGCQSQTQTLRLSSSTISSGLNLRPTLSFKPAPRTQYDSTAPLVTSRFLATDAGRDNKPAEAGLLTRGTRSRRRLEMLIGLACCGLGLLFIQNYLLQKDVIRKPGYKRSLRLISKALGQPVKSASINQYIPDRDQSREIIRYAITTDTLNADVECIISIKDLNRIISLVVFPKPSASDSSPAPITILKFDD